MTSQEEVQSGGFLSDKGVPVPADEEICMNYRPGMLAQIEDELNAERDRMFAEDFFGSAE